MSYWTKTRKRGLAIGVLVVTLVQSSRGAHALREVSAVAAFPFGKNR